MVGQLHQCSDCFADRPVLAGPEVLTEVTDPAQPGWQLYLDAFGRGQIGRVVRMESEPHSLIRNVEPGKAFIEQPTCELQQVRISTTHDDPSKRPGLSPLKSRSVGLDHESPLRINPQRKSFASEPMDRNRDLDMLQEPSETFRVIRVVQTGGQMDS